MLLGHQNTHTHTPRPYSTAHAHIQHNPTHAHNLNLYLHVHHKTSNTSEIPFQAHVHLFISTCDTTSLLHKTLKYKHTFTYKRTFLSCGDTSAYSRLHGGRHCYMRIHACVHVALQLVLTFHKRIHHPKRSSDMRRSYGVVNVELQNRDDLCRGEIIKIKQSSSSICTCVLIASFS